MRSVTVRDGGRPVTQINELEAANGLVYANVCHSNRIAEIFPADGRITAWIDLGALQSQFDKPAGWDPEEHVLNGIAYDPGKRHFYVTGKCWPVLFEIAVLPGT